MISGLAAAAGRRSTRVDCRYDRMTGFGETCSESRRGVNDRSRNLVALPRRRRSTSNLSDLDVASTGPGDKKDQIASGVKAPMARDESLASDGGVRRSLAGNGMAGSPPGYFPPSSLFGAVSRRCASRRFSSSIRVRSARFRSARLRPDSARAAAASLEAAARALSLRARRRLTISPVFSAMISPGNQQNLKAKSCVERLVLRDGLRG